MNPNDGWQAQRTIMIFSEITNDMARDVISQMWGMAAISKDVITLLINSPGGEVPHAMAIIQAMYACPVTVNTTAMGRVYSSGVIILVAGKERLVFPGTMFMTHEFVNVRQVTTGYRALKKMRMADDWTYQNLLEHFKKYTKLSVSEIKKKILSEEYYFDENEAVKMGVIDQIITDKKYIVEIK